MVAAAAQYCFRLCTHCLRMVKFYVTNHISSKSDYPLLRYDVLSIFKMATVDAQYNFRFRIWWCHSLPKVKIYPQIKFRRLILINVWDTTTSGLEIQTSAILEFFYPLRFWPDHSNLCAILHQATKFHANFIHQPRRYDILSIFKMATAAAHYYFLFRIQWYYTLPKAKIYLQTKFRRYIKIFSYFRFWKNKCPPYWNFSPGCHFDHIAVIGMSFCIRMPNFIQMAPPGRRYDVIRIFKDGGRGCSILLPVSQLLLSLL